MKLGTKGRYAVMAMVDLGQNGLSVPVPIPDIASRQGLSTSYLEQLFLKLRRCGLVSSTRGQGGGYVLARHPQDINIAQILAAADEEIKSTRCSMQNKKGCHGDLGHCSTHHLWAGLERHIHAYLSSITLEDICARGEHVQEFPLYKEAS